MRPPFGRLNLSPTQGETTAGEFWTVKKDGEDWPIVVCDEEMVQTFYKGRQRPFNSRQPDGTWPERYKADEGGVSQRCYPTLLLGRLKLIWTPWKMLEPLDKEIGEVIRVSTTNPLLAEAWREAMQYQGTDNVLSYFKGRLRQQRPERFQSKAPAATAPEKRKRKGMPKFKFPPGYRREEVDDEEINSTPKIKQEFSDSTSAEMEGLYEDTDITTQPEPVSKRSKTALAGRFSVRPVYVRPGTPFRSGTVNPFSSEMRQSVSRATPMVRAKKKDVNDPNRVTIYVDNPHKKFRVKRSGLNASPLLKNLVAHNPENRWYVMSPMLSNLNADDFLPVSQYLERSEYDPNILDEGTEYVRLEMELTEPERGAEVVRCATIYSIAQMLELPRLQTLAFRKLKALARWEPHQPFAILCVVDLVFEKGDQDLRQYLVQYLAEHYWDLVLAETAKFSEMMKENEELAKEVHGLLSGAATSGAAMEVDEVKKEDENASGKVKKDESFLSDRTAKADKSDEEGPLTDEAKEETVMDQSEKAIGEEKKATVEDEEEKVRGENEAINIEEEKITVDGDEGISQTEAEMIRMALRKSDKEATEEDLTKMIEDQSKFFF